LGKRKVVSESEIKPRMPDEEFEVVGTAEKFLGNDKIMVRCQDGFTRLCRIRGKMKRRAWIRINDIIIVSLGLPVRQARRHNTPLSTKPSGLVEEQRLRKSYF
jgi:initiation factor 1A